MGVGTGLRLLTAGVVIGGLGATVEAAAVHEITTTFDHTTWSGGPSGAMFDLTNTHSSLPIELTGSFVGHFRDGEDGDVELWWRDGSYHNNWETNDDGSWSQLGSTVSWDTDGADATNGSVHLPFDVGDTLRVDPGQTVGLYFFVEGGTWRLTHSAGTSPTEWNSHEDYGHDVMQVEDDHLLLTLGIFRTGSSSDPFDNSNRTVNTERAWNGTIHYQVVPLPAAAWAGGALLALIGGMRMRKRRETSVIAP